MAVSIVGFAVAFAIAAASLHAVAALGMVARHHWWSSLALTAAASSLHVCALHFGPLTVVQPLGVLSLAFALILSAALGSRRVVRREWVGMALSMAGIAGLLLFTSPTRPRSELTSPQIGVLTSTVVLLVLAAVVAAGRMHLRPVRRSLLYALAAGVTFGVSSALAQTVTIRVADTGWTGLLNPASIVVVTFAGGGLALARAAYRGGLGAPLATATIINPVAAAAIGIGLLGERLGGGAGTVTVAALAAVVAGTGVVLLARGSNRPVTPAVSPEPVEARS